MATGSQPSSVQLNDKIQKHPYLKGFKTIHSEDLVEGYPANDQHWQGWYSISNSPQILGEIKTTKQDARDSAAQKMMEYIDGHSWPCKNFRFDLRVSNESL